MDEKIHTTNYFMIFSHSFKFNWQQKRVIILFAVKFELIFCFVGFHLVVGMQVSVVMEYSSNSSQAIVHP